MRGIRKEEAAEDHAEHRQGGPPPRRPLGEAEDYRPQVHAQPSRPHIVQLRVGIGDRRLLDGVEDEDGQYHDEGQGDVVVRLPAVGVRDEGTQGEAEGGSGAEHRAEYPLRARDQLARELLPDQAKCEREYPEPDSLHGPRDKEDGEVRGEGGHRDHGAVDHQDVDQDPLLPRYVPELPYHRVDGGPEDRVERDDEAHLRDGDVVVGGYLG